MIHDPTAIAQADAGLYHAALEAAVRAEGGLRGCVRLTGRDRAALLQRLTTNDIERLTPGTGARTVLLNNAARILDLLTVYALPEQLLVTTSVGQGATLTRFLRSKIFFNDQVEVEDRSDQIVHHALYGPRAAALIAELTGLDARDWPLHHIQAATLNGATVWLARTLPLGGHGFLILAEQAAQAQVSAALAGLPALDAATLEVLRIEQGYPAPRRELSTEYIPLESGLYDAISFTKGCYVGQEIIARMESRRRLAKRLMGLQLEHALAPGGHLQHEGREAGDLTSVALSPRFGPIALAYVRTFAAVPGTRIQLPDGSRATVVALPFGT